MTRPGKALLLCALTALAVPGAGEAQGIKGLIKKKVTQEAKGGEKSADQATRGPKPLEYGGDLIEITEPVAQDYIMARRLHIRLLQEFRKELASYKPSDDYKACSNQVAMSPEAQKIVLQFANLGENATAADVQRVTEKMNLEMQALMKQKCGVDVNEIWPQYKRAQRVADIEQEAAAAFDDALAVRAARKSGPAVVESLGDYAFEPSRKYSLAQERIDAFCEAWRKSKLERDPRGFYFVQGSGEGMYYIYSDLEHDVTIKICEDRALKAGFDKELELLELQR